MKPPALLLSCLYFYCSPDEVGITPSLNFYLKHSQLGIATRKVGADLHELTSWGSSTEHKTAKSVLLLLSICDSLNKLCTDYWSISSHECTVFWKKQTNKQNKYCAVFLMMSGKNKTNSAFTIAMHLTRERRLETGWHFTLVWQKRLTNTK